MNNLETGKRSTFKTRGLHTRKEKGRRKRKGENIKESMYNFRTILRWSRVSYDGRLWRPIKTLAVDTEPV